MSGRKKVLITGGCGFIGCNFAKKILAESVYDLYILDNLSPQIHGDIPIINAHEFNGDSIKVIRGEITNKKLLTEVILSGIDTIIHLAAETGTAQSMYEIDKYNYVNSYGTAVLMDILANEKSHTVTKVILASSRSVYGEGAYYCDNCADTVYPESRSAELLKQHAWEPVCPVCYGKTRSIATAENAMIKPASIYAATKFAQEELVRISCSSLGIDNIILRFQNVYGAGQSLNNPYTGILSIFSTRIRNNLTIPVFEDGEESRDFVHVSDVVEAIKLAIELGKGHAIYNVGSGRAVSIAEVAQLLAGAFNSKSKIEVTKQFRLGDIRHCYADLYLIKKDLGFIPKKSIKDGIYDFAQWVKTQPLVLDRLENVNKELDQKGMLG